MKTIHVISIVVLALFVFALVLTVGCFPKTDDDCKWKKVGVIDDFEVSGEEVV